MTYKNLYEGVDLALSLSQEGDFKFDFIVSSEDALKKIQWKYEGLADIIFSSKNIKISSLLGGGIKEDIPESYFLNDKQDKRLTNVNYKKDKNGMYSFECDQGFGEKLVIDPCSYQYSKNWGTYMLNSGPLATDDAFGVDVVADPAEIMCMYWGIMFRPCPVQ